MINKGAFPEDWKRSHVVSIHKKELKNVIKKYRPINLFIIIRKVFETLAFN